MMWIVWVHRTFCEALRRALFSKRRKNAVGYTSSKALVRVRVGTPVLRRRKEGRDGSPEIFFFRS